MSRKVQLNLNGNVLVKKLQHEFNEKTGAVLYVYKGNSNHRADENDKLSDVRIARSEESSFDFVRNTTVGSFESFMEEHGKLKVKVWGSNGERIDGSVTLYNGGKEEEEEEENEKEVNVDIQNDIRYRLIYDLARQGSYVSNFIQGNFLEKIFSSSKNDVKVNLTKDKNGNIDIIELQITPSGWKQYLFLVCFDDNDLWFGACHKNKDKNTLKTINNLHKNGALKIEIQDNNDHAQICNYSNYNKKLKSMDYNDLLQRIKVESVEYFNQIISHKKLLADNDVQL